MVIQDFALTDFRGECEAIHKAIFNDVAPVGLSARYCSVLKQFAPGAEACAEIQRLISLGVDLEAIEFALRLSNPSNALTQRFKVVLYLCEAMPGYDRRFVNRKKGFLIGLFALAYQTVRSIVLVIKGLSLRCLHKVRI